MKTVHLFVAFTTFIIADTGWSQVSKRDYQGHLGISEANPNHNFEHIKNSKNSVSTDVAPKVANTNISVSVPYKTGDSTLTVAAKKAIIELIENVSDQGPIDRLYIAVWPDSKLTLNRGESKDLEEKFLVHDRTKILRQFLATNYSNLDFRFYDMSRQTGFLSGLFRTDESALKKAVSGAKNQSLSREHTEIVKRGEASTAVIVAKMWDKKQDNRQVAPHLEKQLELERIN